MERKHIIIFLIGLFMLSFVSESFSQRRSSRSRTTSDRDRNTESATSFKDNIAYDIFVGTLGFNGGFSLSAKAGAGYKPVDIVTIGGGGKFLYQFVNNFGPNDFSSFSYALFPYARVKLGESFYLKGEFNFYSFDTGFDNADRINFTFPMVGGGYVQGFGQWRFGFEALLLVNDRQIDNPFFAGVEASDLYTLIEYNISFLYNF